MWDQSETPNLERTNLSNCTNLACVPSSIQSFNSLSTLCLKGCKSLRSFPNKLHFVCQVTIDFSSCVNLTEFPKISGNITKLDLSETAIEEVPSSIGCLTKLEWLFLSECTRLKRLSTRICKLKSLFSVDLNDCLNLESFPEILEKMELLKCLFLERTAITELPSSIANLEGLEELSLDGCSKLDKLPDNIGNLKSLNSIYAHESALSQLPSSIVASNKLKLLYFSGCRSLVSLPQLFLSVLSSLESLHLFDCVIQEIPQDICCLSLLKDLNLTGNNFESIKQLSRLTRLYLSNCNMLQSLPELPLFLEVLDASNCQRLQSLPDIPSCLEELDTSMLDMPSKFSYRSEISSVLEMISKYSLSSSSFQFINCLKLNETSNNKILADSQLRIQHMAIASLRTFQEKGSDKIYVQKEGYIIFPGSKIPDWFIHQSSGKSITIQLPQHYCSRNLLIGFALCAVIEFKQVSSYDSQYGYTLEIKTPSETILKCYGSSKYYAQSFIDTDYLILGFKSCCGVVPPDGNHHTIVSLNFYDYEVYKVKYCGVCPVYANPNETKPNTFTLKFDTTYESMMEKDKSGGETNVTESSKSA